MTVNEDADSRRINAQLAQLRREIQSIVERIDRLQGEVVERAGQTAQPPETSDIGPVAEPEPEPPVPEREPEPEPPRPEPVAASVEEREPESWTARLQDRPAETPARPRQVADTGELRLPFRDLPSVDWERVLGRNWLAIIGALALAVGIGFFLKLSFDNNWIGDTGRILLGLGTGAVLMGLGEYTSRRTPIWSQAVTAGGTATLYLSIYAGYALYELVRPDLAFLALGGVVALAGALAIRYDSRVIGFLGVLGAFIAPILLGPELPDVRLVLPYIAVVDLGILGVAAVRNWRWFIFAGWVGSYGLFAAGYAQYPDTDPLLFQAGLTAIFLIFVGATTLFHITWRRIPGSLDMTLVTVNAVAYFGLTTIVLLESYDDWLWVVAAAMAAIYGLIALVAYTRPGAPPQTAMITLPIALVFLTVAVPLRLSGVWLTTAWAAQGAILIWSGFVLGRVPMRAFGLGALTLATIHLLMFPPQLDADTFAAFIEQRFVVFVFVIAAMYVAVYLYLRFRESAFEMERHARAALLAVANAVTLIALSLAAIHYYGFGSIPTEDWSDRSTRIALERLLVTLTVIWMVYGVAVVLVGLTRGMRLARLGAVTLFGIAFAKLVLLDTFFILPAVDAYVPLLNLKFMSFVAAAAPVAAVGYLYRNAIRSLVDWEHTTFRTLFVTTNLLVVWALMVEATHFFFVREEQFSIDRTEPILLSFTVIWALYGAILLSMGLWKNLELARWGGLGLLGFAAAKAVLVDTFSLFPDEETYGLVLNAHFGTNAATVGAIVVTSLLFRRLGSSIPERERQMLRWLPATAGALALWSMSLEAIHYFAVREELLGVDQESGVHLTLTVLWAIYGIGVIIVGFLRDVSRIRLVGIALLAVPVIKLFAFDVFLLEQIYRVAAFVILGVLLLGTGLAYQRYSEELRGFLMGRGDDRG